MLNMPWWGYVLVLLAATVVCGAVIAAGAAAMVGGEWWENRRKPKAYGVAAEAPPDAKSRAHAIPQPEADSCAPAATASDSGGIDDRRVPRYHPSVEAPAQIKSDGAPVVDGFAPKPARKPKKAPAKRKPKKAAKRRK